MEYNAETKEMMLNRKVSELDKFVIDFVSLIDKYVIVSGYVSILTGRSRSTEDVDLLVPRLSFVDFNNIWKKIYAAGFECLNTSVVKEAFGMIAAHAIRFAKKDKPIPNIEFKIIKDDIGRYAIENKIKVILSDGILFISPLELQISYKLFLAADGKDDELRVDKDIEDARYLYKLFQDKINKEELLVFVNKFRVKNKMRLLE